MDRILGQILRQAVWERLDLLDELADRADAESLASVARTELPRLTGGWRALLAAHGPDSRGRCPECSSRWRPQAAPCTVWRTAHESLVAIEQTAAATQPGPRSGGLVTEQYPVVTSVTISSRAADPVAV